MILHVYARASNFRRLTEELTTAFPELAPVSDPELGMIAVMTVGGIPASRLELGLPEGFVASRIDPVLDAHDPTPDPLPLLAFVERIDVNAVLRTVDDSEQTVFTIPAKIRSIYRARLELNALDAGSGACKFMEGRLVWKRLTGVNVIAPPTNITVVSQIQDTAAASWTVNGIPSGSNFRIFVRGAAGRTIDWALVGVVSRYAPEGIS